jgi:predicted nicotinamide N-methyase
LSAAHRAFVGRHATLRRVPGLAGIRLHLSDDVLGLWRQTQIASGRTEAPLPYWAFAWAGGLALARYLGEHPDAVAGCRVIDLGSGSGVCAIAAMRAGATSALAIDVDPLAIAAIELNARANGVRVQAVCRDVLDDVAPRDADVVLAGDTWYEAGLAGRVGPWLQRASAAGLDVLVGDPGRRYLPADDLEALAQYDVRTTTELEDLDQKVARVYRILTTGSRPEHEGLTTARRRGTWSSRRGP